MRADLCVKKQTQNSACGIGRRYRSHSYDCRIRCQDSSAFEHCSVTAAHLSALCVELNGSVDCLEVKLSGSQCMQSSYSV